jgi:hypothetical protein
MCSSCGCGKPNDQHGDEAHITHDRMKRAADAAGVSVTKVAQNMLDSARQVESSGKSTSSGKSKAARTSSESD